MGGQHPLIVRWTEDFDCQEETEWWYVIKDTKFDINELKAKRRYEINKGKKFFEVKRIESDLFIEELFKIQIAAYQSWPAKYRPDIDEQKFRKELMQWKDKIVYGAFERETGALIGYAKLEKKEHTLDFNILRVNPAYEHNGVNAAIVCKIVEDYNNQLSKDFYILDGSRAIRHETQFQDYLEKYFGFRKAYCKLRVLYRFPLNIIVKMFFPFRHKINNESKIGNLIMSVMRMEEIRRSCV